MSSSRSNSNRPSFTRSKEFTARIEKLIPGGSHTYSRGRDRFPLESPNGITRGKGCRVWDADGNVLIDWSMGLTAVSLGHAYDPVDDAVCAALRNGVLFQRSAQLELEAAEAITDLTGADMVKFGRHGSTVNTAAVKLARAHTGRSHVAVPKEHPFFSFDDWFIGSTEADFGIPETLKSFTLKFGYNDLDSLARLFKERPDDIACVMLEPVKFDAPAEGFLGGVRELCDRHGAVLIFDEMISGLKFPMPGACEYLGIKGDLRTFGKGIANGYASAAIVGNGDIMRLGGLEPEGARKLFLLSTTHGGESVGLAATIATLKQFKDGSIIASNWEKGRALQARLRKVAEAHGLTDNIVINGYPCLMSVQAFDAERRPSAELATLLMQEMIAGGVLLQGLLFPTPSHDEQAIDQTVSAFDAACDVLKQAISSGSTAGLLMGPPVKPVFRKKN